MRSSRVRALAIPVALALAWIGTGGAGPAGAQPDNDTQAGAVEITALPFHSTESTLDATVDAGDSVASSYCFGVGAPAFEHSVWFKAVVPDGLTNGITVDTSASDYGTGIAVLQDNGGTLSAVSCTPRTFVSPGVPPAGTYYLVVFGDGTTDATAGLLDISVSESAPPPDVQLTISPNGTATKEGGAWISGTVTCTSADGGGNVFEVDGQVTQRVGRMLVQGSYYSGESLPCDGSSYLWKAYAPPENGLFRGGQTVTVTNAFGCNNGGCNGAYLQAKVKLNRANAK